ncbi:MAG TPA: hypothetical protein PK076_09015 [Saprospiraceae bacterium]|nr:hypothetical protein [Saprospiraceae bacterium]HQW56255.1 hypothetical protein [Saprospiraceae bacterium]
MRDRKGRGAEGAVNNYTSSESGKCKTACEMAWIVCPQYGAKRTLAEPDPTYRWGHAQNSHKF